MSAKTTLEQLRNPKTRDAAIEELSDNMRPKGIRNKEIIRCLLEVLRKPDQSTPLSSLVYVVANSKAPEFQDTLIDLILTTTRSEGEGTLGEYLFALSFIVNSIPGKEISGRLSDDRVIDRLEYLSRPESG